MTLERRSANPGYVVAGRRAGRGVSRYSWSEAASVGGSHIAVVYRELNGDGFIITAFFISRFHRLLRREILWQKELLAEQDTR